MKPRKSTAKSRQDICAISSVYYRPQMPTYADDLPTLRQISLHIYYAGNASYSSTSGFFIKHDEILYGVTPHYCARATFAVQVPLFPIFWCEYTSGVRIHNASCKISSPWWFLPAITASSLLRSFKSGGRYIFRWKRSRVSWLLSRHPRRLRMVTAQVTQIDDEWPRVSLKSAVH